MKTLILILTMLLCSCGGGGGESSVNNQTANAPAETPANISETPPEKSQNNIWKGGLYKIWEAQGTLKGYFILHQGHSAWNGKSPAGPQYDHPEYDLTSFAEQLSAAGYRVYGFEMPPLPHNVGPIERFYQPVIDLLDKIAGDGFPVYMAGFSGGGWTTTNVTALDQRIKKGYSIQGDAPLTLFDPQYTEWDEYTNTKYDYMTLYAMAGRRLLHIYGKKDIGPYGFVDSEAAGYPIIYDDTAITHEVTPWVINFILEDLNASIELS